MRLIVTPFIVAATATSAFAAEGGGFPPFDSSTFGGQLFWLAITFGTLYLLMSRVALPRIASILNERQPFAASCWHPARWGNTAAGRSYCTWSPGTWPRFK